MTNSHIHKLGKPNRKSQHRSINWLSEYKRMSDDTSGVVGLLGESGLAREEWVPLSKRHKLSILRIVCICGSMMTYQFAYSVLSALSTPLMNDILDLPSWATQMIWAIGPIVGLFYQPFVGHWSDQVHAKFGRRRPFIITGSLGTIGIFTVLFCIVKYSENFSVSARRGIFVASLAVAHIFINTMQGPARTLIGDVVPKGQQVLANSIGTIMIAAAAVLLNVLGGFQVSKLVHTMNDAEMTFMFGMIFMVVGMIMTVVAGKEEQFTETGHTGNPVVKMFKALLQMPRPALIAAFALMLSWVAYWPWYTNCTAFYQNDIIHDSEDGLAFGMLVIALQSFISCLYGFVQHYVVNLIGMKWAWFLAQMLEVAMFLPTHWIKNKWALMVMQALVGIPYTTFQTIPFSLVGMLVDDDKMGTCMCGLSIFVGIGQQIGALVICSGIGHIFGKHYGQIISISSAFAALAGITAFFVPTSHRPANEPNPEPLIKPDA